METEIFAQNSPPSFQKVINTGQTISMMIIQLVSHVSKVSYRISLHFFIYNLCNVNVLST